MRTLSKRLLGGYADEGFSVDTDGDHVYFLYFKDKLIGRYLQNNIQQFTLRNACCQYLNELNLGVA